MTNSKNSTRIPVASKTGNKDIPVPIRFGGARNEDTGFQPKGASQWEVLGSTVSDATYDTKEIVLNDHEVRFRTSSGLESLLYSGPRFDHETGGKRVAATDLGGVADRIGAHRVNGGGVMNTTRELARLCGEKRSPISLRTINSSSAWPELDGELAALGIEHAPLGLTPATTNLVLTNGDGPLRRFIFKSPEPSSAPLNGEWNRVMDQSARPDVLLINSARPEELVRAAVMSRVQQGARAYSLATISIPVEARIKLLLPNSRVTQFNLEEFVDLCDALGIECPDEERMTAVPGVGEAVADLVQTLPFPAPDLVVTMGEVGMVVYDSRKGCICHVGLSREALAATRSYLSRDAINGIGDRTFAALVLAYETATVAPECSRIVRAARQAWADVLQGSTRFLQPKSPAWFQVTVLVCECFGTQWTQLPSVNVAQPNVSWPEQAL